MNLQGNSPYMPCPFKCPYCCASFTNEKSLYNDERANSLYCQDRAKYFAALNAAIDLLEPDNIVITGSTEPTLFPRWVQDVVTVLTLSRGLKNVEVTTKNIEYEGEKELSAVSYSFHKAPRLIHKSNAEITRAVFILHDGLSIDDIIGYHQRYGRYFSNGQTTVKNLAKNSYGNAEVNNWIEAHRVNLSQEDIFRLRDNGISYDHDCNNSEGRYRIFRADGNLYDSWQALEPITLYY